jgi:hypothetical protein
MVCFTQKEINLINHKGLDVGKSFIDIYESQWFDGRISDKKFDDYVKIATKLGYRVSSRKEIEKEFE